MIELKYKGQLYKLHEFTYDETPSNLCGLFWKTLFAVPLLLFTWISYPVDADGLGERLIKSLAGWFLMGVLALIVAGTFTQPWTALAVFGITIGGLVALVFIAWCVEARPWQGRIAKPHVIEIAQEVKALIKDKYCPRIQWK